MASCHRLKLPTPSARPRESCGPATTGPGEGQGLGVAGFGGFQRRHCGLKWLVNYFPNDGVTLGMAPIGYRRKL
jgi:hypothetical protein